MSTNESDRSGVGVIARAAAILRTLEDEPTGLSLGAIAKKSGLPRSTVQRMVDALAQQELLEVHGPGGVCLGPALMRLASHSHVDITLRARPYLEELSKVTGETAVLSGASGAELQLLHTVVSPNALRVAPVAGNFLSIYATAGGKILLAAMQEKSVMAILGTELKPLTPKTLTLTQLMEELEHIRNSGFASDFDEHTIGVGAVAIGLQTPQGQYAIDVVGPVWRMEEKLEIIKTALTACQKELTDAMRSIARSGLGN